MMTSGLALMIPPRVVNMPDIGVEMHFGPEFCLTVRSVVPEGEWSHRADAMANGIQHCGLGQNAYEAEMALRKSAGEGVLLIPPRPHVGYGSVDLLREVR